MPSHNGPGVIFRPARRHDIAPCCAEGAGRSCRGRSARSHDPRDIDRSRRASAPDTVIRHRAVARPYAGVLARGARINRSPRNKIGRRQFKMAFRAIRGRTYSVASSAKATYVADGSGTDGPVVRLARSCSDDTADGRSDSSRTTQGVAIWRGTGSSNPSPSSGQSASRGISPSHTQKPGFFPRVCGAGQAARSAETGVTR
jgi:hypothetical protein